MGFMLSEKMFSTDEVELAYVEGPKSGPPFIILPGASRRWQEYYIPMMPLLQQRWQVIGFNYRGYGKSGRTPGAYKYSDYCRDIVAFINSFDEKPVIFGHSLGGILAVGAAAEKSDKLRGVIFADAPITNESTKAWIGQDLVVGWSQAMVKVINEGGSVWEIASKLGEGSISPISLSTARSLSELDAGVFDFLGRVDDSMEGYDMDSMLERITCPVLLIQADDVGIGKAMTDKDVQIALSVLPYASLFKVNGVSHGLGFDGGATEPQVMNAVMSFLESLR